MSGPGVRKRTAHAAVYARRVSGAGKNDMNTLGL
jgi:hypothetical protein